MLALPRENQPEKNTAARAPCSPGVTVSTPTFITSDARVFWIIPRAFFVAFTSHQDTKTADSFLWWCKQKCMQLVFFPNQFCVPAWCMSLLLLLPAVRHGISCPYMTTGKIIALTRQTFVDKVMSLLCNMLSRLVITFLPRSKCLLISWLQSPSAVRSIIAFFLN